MKKTKTDSTATTPEAAVAFLMLGIIIGFGICNLFRNTPTSFDDTLEIVFRNRLEADARYLTANNNQEGMRDFLIQRKQEAINLSREKRFRPLDSTVRLFDHHERIRLLANFIYQVSNQLYKSEKDPEHYISNHHFHELTRLYLDIIRDVYILPYKDREIPPEILAKYEI